MYLYFSKEGGIYGGWGTDKEPEKYDLVEARRAHLFFTLAQHAMYEAWRIKGIFVAIFFFSPLFVGPF